MEYTSLETVRIRIDKNYDCVKELEKLISLQITDQEKLEIISCIGKMYAYYVTGVYSSSVLENHLLEIGKKLKFRSSKEPKSDHMLIVMSEAAMVGGHTVLVHNWIKWDDENRYSVVFTNMEERNIPGFLNKVVQRSGGETICLTGTYVEKASKLQKISQDFQRIIIFTHMEDVIPVLAYGSEDWKIPVYFYNHADFRFSYGFSVSDVVLNLCEYDVDKTIRYRGVDKKNSICFQFPGYGEIDEDDEKIEKTIIRKKINRQYKIHEKEKLIVSMGSDFKYGNIIGYEFDSYVREVLFRSGVETTFLIIGADKDKDKWVRLKSNTHGKARALGILPRNQAEQLISAADIFVVSFPMAAYGKSKADKMSVPCLRLDMFGRGVDQDDIGVARTVPELIEKTLDILNGNENKYLSQHKSYVWTKEKWKEKWKKICNSVTKHEVHLFYPQRLIEQQELVNCQIMQEKAGEGISFCIQNFYLSEWVKEELFRLDRKYEMGIIRNHMFSLEKKCGDLEKLSDKHLRLYLTTVKWIKLKQKGRSIGDYLYRQGYRTVAIYGMGHMGKCLTEELENSFVKVLYGIDRNAAYLHFKVPIFEPSDMLESVDMILNTTTVNDFDILQMICLDNIEIHQLDTILDLIC